jgi:tRNA pseudouridine55 synthase
LFHAIGGKGLDGVLPLWKPKGMTSHDCIYKIRRLTGIKKVGHTGTLDPEVEGVLPICFGQATKISSIIMESKKVYEAKVTIGYATETEDYTGKIIEEKKVDPSLKLEHIRHHLSAFIGEIEQIPPMYSAVKVNGKRLYEYARQGHNIERPARRVTIYSIDLISNDLQWEENTVSFWIRVACSKGTYIRTLCVDIGRKLGYPAHMGDLVRMESGSFTKDDAITFQQLEEAIQENSLEKIIKPIDEALEKYDTLIVEKEDILKIQHGQVLPYPKGKIHTDPFRIKTKDGKVLALYQQHPAKPELMKPFKMFVQTGN